MNVSPPEQLRFSKLWTALGIGMLIVILALSLIPYTGPIFPITFADKLLHALAFTTLIVWFSALVAQDRWPELFGLLLVYGVFMEVLQYFTGYRIMDWQDIVADVLGLTIGWGMMTVGCANWARSIERLLGAR